MALVALQAQLDAARNKLDAELDQQDLEPQDNLVAAFQERAMTRVA